MKNKNVEDYLKSICDSCIKANERCIKEDPYIGLCAVNDREEIIILYEDK